MALFGGKVEYIIQRGNDTVVCGVMKMAKQQAYMTQELDGTGMSPAQNADIRMLQNAAEYNIDLDALESVGKKSFRRKPAAKKVAEDWRKLDVNLSDIINLIIATSERPTFMVRDDKLVYLNPAAMQLLDIGVDKDVIDNNFLNLVIKEDWNPLAENIGEILTNGKTMRIRLNAATGKIIPLQFQAIYLSEIEHFSFILLGEHIKKTIKPTFNNLYDDVTGLPNFFLFEDRVQVAVALENAKDNVRDQSIIAVLAISIDNIEAFRKMHIEELVIKKTANNLVLNLKKNATVALGLKYNFWIMLPGLKNMAEVNHEVRRIAEILNDGVSDNFTRHELLFSIGVSTFPRPGHSAKKVIEQAIAAIKTAQATPRSTVEFFSGEKV